MRKENNRLICEVCDTRDYAVSLQHKLQIAAEALQFYADMEETRETKEQGSNRWIYTIDDNYGDLAQQALEQIESEILNEK